MTALASQVALGVALKCLPPALAPIAVGITRGENPKLDLQAVNHNANGISDYGLAQFNFANFAWLSRSMRTPVNERTILDLYINLQSSVQVLFAKYNSNPPDVLRAAYAAGVIATILAGAEAPPEAQVNNDDPQPPASEAQSVISGRLRTQELWLQHYRRYRLQEHQITVPTDGELAHASTKAH
jgi:hypothetical protein